MRSFRLFPSSDTFILDRYRVPARQLRHIYMCGIASDIKIMSFKLLFFSCRHGNSKTLYMSTTIISLNDIFVLIVISNRNYYITGRIICAIIVALCCIIPVAIVFVSVIGILSQVNTLLAISTIITWLAIIVAILSLKRLGEETYVTIINEKYLAKKSEKGAK